MAINTLATATLFQNTLDKVAIQEAVTGWMDSNAGQVIYNGGSEVKIPKMEVQGMGDYDRDNGYQQGSVTLTYETRSMIQDRGRKFQLDPMDINENNFVTTAAAVMGVLPVRVRYSYYFTIIIHQTTFNRYVSTLDSVLRGAN
ncbi:hypothetical protein LAD12857_30120 [Lacrimispora amygdalina]|uniref:Uncharacterized protein n=1 Tax=Lacrimispora amygdalina TaxID=253257 RepID=A0ABQ5M812_9FIRM